MQGNRALPGFRIGRDRASTLYEVSRRSPQSAVDILRWRAEREGDRLAYSFLVDGDDEIESVSYADLDRRVRALAGRLVDAGATGERALLLHPSGLDFLVALLGCFYAGVVAVPLYPPKLARRDARWLEVSHDAAARFALTTDAVGAGLHRAMRHSPELGTLHWISSEDVSDEGGLTTFQSADGSGLAYLQYTSGSTRAPKGVMVSHENLRANIDDIQRNFLHREDDVIVSWLPHFHDMGLVYGLLAPLVLGIRCYFMPPAAFIQRPVRWLQAISRFGATHSGGPNFAYELCAERITDEQKHGLDLSGWAVAFNGAEPVRHETLQRFTRAFAACGFSPMALCAAYGLAEATLKVTTGHRSQGASCFSASARALGHSRVRAAASDFDRKALVGCGAPGGDTEVVIVDPETLEPCPPDVVGEIWVSGPGVAKGYWNRPDESALVFQASLAGEPPPGRFLRTGDLGFLKDGELFVNGRLKDLIIVRGRNHYPQDIEFTAQHSHPALRPDGCAALSVTIAGDERLVIVQEIDRHQHGEADAAVTQIRAAISEEHEVAPYAVVLVRQNGVPKTSSGKIQRSACARAFLDGSLPMVYEWKEVQLKVVDTADAGGDRSREDIEAFLAERLAASLAISADEIDFRQPFSSFGLDSLRTMELLADVEEWLGRDLSPTSFWNYPTIADLAAHLAASNADAPAAQTGDV